MSEFQGFVLQAAFGGFLLGVSVCNIFHAIKRESEQSK